MWKVWHYICCEFMRYSYNYLNVQESSRLRIWQGLDPLNHFMDNCKLYLFDFSRPRHNPNEKHHKLCWFLCCFFFFFGLLSLQSDSTLCYLKRQGVKHVNQSINAEWHNKQIKRCFNWLPHSCMTFYIFNTFLPG